MVLHSLYIVINDAVIEAKQSQKISQKFVPLGDFMCQALTARRQNKSAIFLVFQKALRIEPLHHVRHAGL